MKKLLLLKVKVGIYETKLFHNKGINKMQKNTVMKKSADLKLLILIAAAILYSLSSTAQGFTSLDKAPHDISYYRESMVSSPLVKVIYGRPSVNSELEVFGTKVPFNEVWRTGANEATEIKIYNDVLFGDKIVSAGTYTLYTIPGEDQWEIILSSNTDVMGAFQYDPVFNVAKIKVQVKKAEKINTFSISFKKKSNNNISMILAWGSTRVKVPLDFNEQIHYADNYQPETIYKH